MAPTREVMPVDVLFVGAGPASLAGAYHLLSLVEQHNERVSGGAGAIPDLEVAIVEKGKTLGAHAISGAVMDPRGLAELMPDFLEQGFPFESEVTSDDVVFLTEKGSFRLPLTPPPLDNHGNYILSISKLVRWLGEKVEAKGAFIIPEFAAREPLFEGDRLQGVRTSDKGVDKHGERKGNYQPGADITARVTVLGEGPRGSLTKSLTAKYGLDRGKIPQVYAAGVKETWKLAPGKFPPGHVVHTMGWPLDTGTFGGGFAYGGQDQVLSLGFVTSLDYWHPETDPHAELQRFKAHPKVASWLEGGEVISYGAKTIPEGGWFARPTPYFEGGLLIADSGGLLNSMRLKGIHLGIKSGMLAAEVRGTRAGLLDQGRDVESAELPSGHGEEPLHRNAPDRVPDSHGWEGPLREPSEGRGRSRANEEAVRAFRWARPAARQHRQREDLRQADERLPVGRDARRRSALPLAGGRPGHLPNPVRRGVR
jgi:electron-transferring-flavoprotein dehydrogenase